MADEVAAAVAAVVETETGVALTQGLKFYPAFANFTFF